MFGEHYADVSAFAGHAGLDGFGGLLLRQTLQRGDMVAFADFITLPFRVLAKRVQLLLGNAAVDYGRWSRAGRLLRRL